MKPRGGARPNAGRKPGSGKYGCPSTAIRVPAHLVEDVELFCRCMMRDEGVMLINDVQEVWIAKGHSRMWEKTNG